MDVAIVKIPVLEIGEISAGRELNLNEEEMWQGMQDKNRSKDT